MQKHRLLILGALCLPALLFAIPASAQNWNNREAGERLARLEDEVNALRQQRGAAGGAGMNAAAAGQMDMRLTHLESQLRDLTGIVERNQYQTMQTQNRLERMAQDLEVRFQEVQRQQAAVQQAAAAAPAPAPTIIEGTDEDDAPAAAGAAKPAANNAAANAAAQNLYDEGFAKLRQADYAGAEKAFRKFLDNHGSHQLAGNASYWLGETYYVRGQFKEAAVTFADGYQKYPKNSKAPDNLLKLAMALGSLGSKEDACLTLGELKTKYPNAAPTIRTRADQERKKLACKA